MRCSTKFSRNVWPKGFKPVVAVCARKKALFADEERAFTSLTFCLIASMRARGKSACASARLLLGCACFRPLLSGVAATVCRPYRCSRQSFVGVCAAESVPALRIKSSSGVNHIATRAGSVFSCLYLSLHAGPRECAGEKVSESLSQKAFESASIKRTESEQEKN